MLSRFHSLMPMIVMMAPITNSPQVNGRSCWGYLTTKIRVGIRAQTSAVIASIVGQIFSLSSILSQRPIAIIAMIVANFSVFEIFLNSPFLMVNIKITIGLNARIPANITVILSVFGFVHVVSKIVKPTTLQIDHVTTLGLMFPFMIPIVYGITEDAVNIWDIIPIICVSSIAQTSREHGL